MKVAQIDDGHSATRLDFNLMNTKIFIFFILWTTTLCAGPLYQFFDGVRPTGMGNAFIALADDANALWYNPAALAEVEGIHFNAFNAILGVDSLNTLDRLNKAITKSQTEQLLRQDKEFLRFNFMPSLIFPNGGIAIFTQSQGFFDTSDLVNRGLTALAANDQGVILGGGISLIDNPSLGVFSVGASIRAFIRSSLEFDYTPQQIIDQFGPSGVTDLLNNLYSTLSNKAGLGYGFGLNAGMKYQLQLKSKRKLKPKVCIAATGEDIGGTIFGSLGSKNTPGPIPGNYSIGTALIYPISQNWFLNFTADAKNFRQRTGRVNILHLGTEIRNSVFGLRAGINDGNLSYGFSLEFPPHTRIHFSSYSGEPGPTQFKSQIRSYLVQINIGFNPN